MSFNFMAEITICSDFGAQKIKSDTVSTVSPSISHEHSLYILNMSRLSDMWLANIFY